MLIIAKIKNPMASPFSFSLMQKTASIIKEMNKKLNQVEAGFVPLSFKQPKRQEKKVVDFAFEPTLAQMKYDIIVDDDDDFDI